MTIQSTNNMNHSGMTEAVADVLNQSAAVPEVLQSLRLLAEGADEGKIGNPLIDQLDPSIRNGSYFNNTRYVLYYVLFYIAVAVLFDLYHRLVTYIHNKVQPSWYMSKA